MRDKERENTEGAGGSLRGPVSRRQFLKMAGVAGATLGLGAGLGGFLAACGSEEENTTTSAAGEATTTIGGTETTGGATTSVSASGEAGRDLKVGLVEPKTGALASYAVPNDWWTGHAAAAVADGIVGGDGKVHKIEILRVDTQSDSNRAAQVTGDLILNDNVDVIMAAGSPDTVVPVADQCEANATPAVFTHCPWQAVFKRESTPEQGYSWIYGLLNGAEQTMADFTDMFDQVPNNKIVGMLFANDADAQAWMRPDAAPAVFDAKGYTLIVPTPYQSGAEDFTAQISMFKKEGVDIISGTNTPPDFTNFWKQSIQQGLQPKLVSTGKALLFPQTLEAIGDIGYNLIGEMQWSPAWPFKDSLTGMTCAELGADFEAKSGQQWTQVIGEYAMFEWVVDAFKRATNPEDKAAVAAALGTTNLMTCKGPIDFSVEVGSPFHPVINNVKPLYAGGQWVKGTGQYQFDFLECSNAAAPGTEVQAAVLPMAY